MIKVDENDPIGEVQLSFPYRDVQIRRNEEPKNVYTLEEEVGRGKFGTVYRCKEIATGLNLAAKFISCPKKEDRRNVEREIDIMKTLQHPRLIQIYDAFENGKVMTVILELIEGGELFERVIDDDFILTEKSCTIFMRQICEGIGFIHKQRILHLDMKPENILCLTKTGNRVKIIDFGLARKYDPDKKLQVLFGTPEFVAPEVVNFDEIGYGTDMWSVGVICYVLLSGLSPFMGHTDVETMANVTIAKYDFDDEAFQDISDNAKDFIEKLLIKDMSRRMTAEECLDHEWLRRKKTILNRSSSMDVTKDNLKQFVERWNEHPNSPYIFEITSYPETLSRQNAASLSGSSQSLIGECHSPCESLGDDDDAFEALPTANQNQHFLRATTSLEPLRRASDSHCFVTKPDIEERINLAEEIRKLSDKLFQLSNIDTSLTNKQVVLHSKPIEIESKKDELPKDHPESPMCGVPWRRSKMRLSITSSRDVPLADTAIYKKPHSNNVNKLSNGFLSTDKTNISGTSPTTNTKNLLLHLLDHWEGPKGPTRPNTRHGSVSTEWTEQDSLGQRTISSLNTFFQSRATNKKITQFHLNKS